MSERFFALGPTTRMFHWFRAVGRCRYSDNISIYLNDLFSDFLFLFLESNWLIKLTLLLLEFLTPQERKKKGGYYQEASTEHCRHSYMEGRIFSCLTPSIFDAILIRETRFRHQARNSARYCTFITTRAAVCVFRPYKGLGSIIQIEVLWSIALHPASSPQ